MGLLLCFIGLNILWNKNFNNLTGRYLRLSTVQEATVFYPVFSFTNKFSTLKYYAILRAIIYVILSVIVIFNNIEIIDWIIFLISTSLAFFEYQSLRIKTNIYKKENKEMKSCLIIPLTAYRISFGYSVYLWALLFVIDLFI